MPTDAHPLPSIVLHVSQMHEFEELATLRIEAMRESLQRIGRFEAQRARERLRAGFAPEMTRHIVLDGERVGFVAVKRTTDGLKLEHLYVRPERQGRGVGSAVLCTIFGEADALGLPLHVDALRGSDSNRFYLRHGFIRVGESEWDIHYLRTARVRKSGSHG